ncbi:MAG: hypothetical protein ACKOFI_05415, partial [Phycisphaerales bacterium]
MRLAATIAAVACLALAGADDPPAPKRAPAGLALAAMTVGGEPVEVEVADTPEARDRGLGSRTAV